MHANSAESKPPLGGEMRVEPQQTEDSEREASTGNSAGMSSEPASFKRRIMGLSIAKPLLPSLLAYTAAWVMTALISSCDLEGQPSPASLPVLLLGFSVPFCVVGGVAAWSTSSGRMTTAIQVCFSLILVLVLSEHLCFPDSDQKLRGYRGSQHPPAEGFCPCPLAARFQRSEPPL